jgi:hypothetical protein
MKNIPLSRFEKMAQHLVEGSFKRLFGGPLEPLEVAARLARALEDSQIEGRAADYFTIRLSPDDYAAIMESTPDLADELAKYVSRLAKQAALTLLVQPQVEVWADEQIGRHQIEVQASHQQRSDGLTTQLQRLDAATEALLALRSVDAFLIVEGRQHLPLDRPFVTLGRRADNDIVLDSLTVSRKHAQIRWRYSRFVLYDVSGRGRTMVNGQPVTEYVLQPGDVISLAQAQIIYGEGREEREKPPAGKEIDQTMIMPKSS